MQRKLFRNATGATETKYQGGNHGSRLIISFTVSLCKWDNLATTSIKKNPGGGKSFILGL